MMPVTEHETDGTSAGAIPPMFIDESSVARALSYRELVAVIDTAFLDPITAPARLVAETKESDGRTRTLLVMPAVRPGGLAVTKLVTVFSGETIELHSQIIVQDPGGAPIAIVAGHELTARRTAAASVLAAKVLGAGDAQTLAVMGAGRQARALLAAYAETLDIRAVRLWARRSEAARALAEFASQWPVSVAIASSPAEAVMGADIVTCATGSQVPLISAGDLAPGAHVDLVGGFRPTMREADDALIARALVVADTRSAITEAGDLTQPIERGIIRADDVLLLSELLNSQRARTRRDFTLFKSVGHAAEDLIAVELLLGKLDIGFGAQL